jgi:L-asparaginase/Glu-tRNA(Gln) amidotransferase subunit D
MSDSKISVIVAGGLIAEKYDQTTDSYIPQKNAHIQTIESLKIETNDQIDLVEFALIDSSCADLDYLYELVKLVQRKINSLNCKGCIVIYGTDTLEILAYFLYRCLVTHNKPIVLTGSMRTENNIDYDGKVNVLNSLRQILNPQCSTYATGVTVNFAGKIHSPAYIHRDHSFALDPFSSERLGLIGIMHINDVVWLNKSSRSTIIPLPGKLESVPICYAYPGDCEHSLDGYVGKFKGIVVIGYGSGNVSNNMYYAIKRVISNGLKVILVTNCQLGGVNSEYGGIGVKRLKSFHKKVLNLFKLIFGYFYLKGNQSLKDLGVIMAQDLNAYQAMVVASLILVNNCIPDGCNLENYFSNKILMN